MTISTPRSSVLLIVFCALALAGCARERVYENIYEGARAHHDTLKSPAERDPAQRSPSYHEYEAERQRQQREN